MNRCSICDCSINPQKAAKVKCRLIKRGYKYVEALCPTCNASRFLAGIKKSGRAILIEDVMACPKQTRFDPRGTMSQQKCNDALDNWLEEFRKER